MAFAGGVNEETEKAESEVGEEEKNDFEDEREHQKGKEPEDLDRRADEDAPESDDVGPIGEFAAGDVGSEKRGSVENGGDKNEGCKD